MSWAALVLHVILVAVAVPVLAVLSNLVRNRIQGRPGPVTQPWRDLARFWAKGAPVPPGTTALFAAGPPAAGAAAVLVLVLVPSFSLGTAAASGADLILLLVLLAVPRGALLLATMDGGTAPGLAPASSVHLGIWPVVALVAMVAVLLSGSTNLMAAATAVRDGGSGARLVGLLAGAAVFTMAVSQPALPDRGFSGRHRALVLLAGWTQQVATLSIVAALAAPFALAPPDAGLDAWAVGAAAWVVKISVLTALAAVFGTRPGLAPVLLPAAAILAVMAVVLSGAPGPA